MISCRVLVDHVLKVTDTGAATAAGTATTACATADTNCFFPIFIEVGEPLDAFLIPCFPVVSFRSFTFSIERTKIELDSLALQLRLPSLSTFVNAAKL